MNQLGYVTKIKGDTAEISVKRSSACGDNCGSCEGGCDVQGVSIMSKNTIGAKVGDYVEIRTQTSTVLKSVFILYIIPLIMMIAGITIGINIFKSLGVKNYELLGFSIGVLFLAFSYVLLRTIDRKAKQKKEISFEIVNIVKSNR